MALDKEQVASAFERHFDELGWESTSIADVAKALNATKQAVYEQFHPDSDGYDADLARFRSRVAHGPSGKSVEPERLFEERLKHGVTDYLQAKRAMRCREMVRHGLECRDDPHEKLLYLVHASMATCPALPSTTRDPESHRRSICTVSASCRKKSPTAYSALSRSFVYHTPKTLGKLHAGLWFASE